MKYKHVALTMVGNREWAKRHKTDLNATYKKSFNNLKFIIKQQVKLNIPILTVYLLPSKIEDSDQLFVLVDSLVGFFNDLIESKILQKNKMKVSILGKWYDLPSRIVDPIKNIVNFTKEYDGFFLNFCINYNGQDEIVDACKLIARQVKADKIDPDVISNQMIKDGLYSSYFIPPDMMILTGNTKKINSFLLWDCAYSEFYFTKSLFPDFDVKEFVKIIGK